MVIDESSRHAMFTRLQEVLGKEHARVLMEHLPPIGWADVATKNDLEALRVATGKDIEALGKDIEAFRVAMGKDIEAFRVAWGKDIEALRHELKADLHSALNRQTRTFVTWLIAGMGTSTAAAVAAARALS